MCRWSGAGETKAWQLRSVKVTATGSLVLLSAASPTRALKLSGISCPSSNGGSCAASHGARCEWHAFVVIWTCLACFECYDLWQHLPVFNGDPVGQHVLLSVFAESLFAYLLGAAMCFVRLKSQVRGNSQPLLFEVLRIIRPQVSGSAHLQVLWGRWRSALWRLVSL